MNKKYLFLIPLAASIFLVSACSQKSNTTKASTSQAQSSQTSSSKESSSSTKDSSSASSTSAEGYQGATKRIGSDEYGYVSIPEEWNPFKDIDGGDSIQFCDGTPINIITLNGYTREKANVEAGEEFTAETIANRIYVNSKNNTQLYQKTWGAMSEIAGNKAYQINSIAKDGKTIVVWVFQTKESEKVYYISLEGTEKKIKELYSLIKSSWSASK